MTTIVSSIDFAKWILEQPDERAVNMYQTDGRDGCGCLMVQYAKDVIGMPAEDISCGAFSFACQSMHDYPRLSDAVGQVLFGLISWYYVHTFGDCKPHVRRFLEAKGD